MGQGWQEPAASAHVPCRPGRGLPKTVVPLWPPRSTSFKLAIWFLPLASLGRQQAQAVDIAVLPVNFSDPGLNCLNLPGEPGADRPGGGVRKPPSTRASLRGPGSPRAPVSELLCRVAAE